MYGKISLKHITRIHEHHNMVPEFTRAPRESDIMRNMDHLKPPSAFSFEGNISKAWKSWKKAFRFFLVGTETDGKSENIKTSTLLMCLRVVRKGVFCLKFFPKSSC